MPQSGAAVSRGERSEHQERAPAPGRGGDPARRPDGADGAEGVPGRRTVTIRGRGSERYVPTRTHSSRRRPERRYERAGFRPDRAAMWAVLLCIIFILAAAMSAHAATLHALVHLR
jgi:hypothetical protein